MNLDVSSRVLGKDAVISVEGEIDLTSSSTLRHHLGEIEASEAVHVVIDLTRVGFIDSTGLSVLVTGADHAHRRGRSFAVVAGPQVRELLRITGLTTVMAVHRSLDDATGITPSASVDESQRTRP